MVDGNDLLEYEEKYFDELITEWRETHHIPDSIPDDEIREQEAFQVFVMKKFEEWMGSKADCEFLGGDCDED